MENVNDRVEKVDAYPQAVSLAFDVEWSGAGFFCAFEYVFGNCSNLGIGFTFAYDEKIRRRILELSQVELDNIFSFDVLNAVDDQVIEGFRRSDGGDVKIGQ